MKPRGRQALVAKFQALAKERLQRLNNCILALETNPDDEESATLLMREIHTLKGEAKLMGFADINLVAHRTEDLLVDSKKRSFRTSGERADFILKAFDLMDHLLSKGAGDLQTAEVDLTEFSDAVKRLLESEGAPEAEAPPAASVPEAEEPAQAAVPAAKESPPPRPQRTTTAAPTSRLSDNVAVTVEVGQLEMLTELTGDLLRLQGQAERSLVALRGAMEESQQTLEHARLQWRRDSALGEEGANGDSELVVSLLQRHKDIHRLLNDTKDSLLASGESLGGLEDTVRSLRLVPLLTLFARYPRAVRDLAKEQGKQITASIQGGAIRVDQAVRDRIDEPLLHLIRNSVDHGLESPEERRGANKPAEGRIKISAIQAGSHVEVTVEDDGRGISPRVVADAAVARGLIARSESEKLSQHDLLQMIWRPGFSTRRKATDISGRGIGLDVVKSNVEALGGRAAIESTMGSGTRFVLHVPISAALTRALVLDMDGSYVALPSHSIVALVRLVRKELISAGGGPALVHGETAIPVADLSALLGWRPNDASNGEHARAAILLGEGRQLAVVLGSVLGERELVQRPFDGFLAASRVVIGASVLEQGQPVIILNVAELIRRSVAGETLTQPRKRTAELPAADEDSAVASARVLIVDDSELFRDVVVGIVAGMGHHVSEAGDGQAALEHVRQELPELVITDLEMPEMGGLELIKRLRSSARTQDLPIIVLSSLGSVEDKQRAADCGADAYVVKSQLDPQVLAQMINRFLSARG